MLSITFNILHKLLTAYDMFLSEFSHVLLENLLLYKLEHFLDKSKQKIQSFKTNIRSQLCNLSFHNIVSGLEIPLRSEPHTNFRTQYVIMTQRRWSPTPWHTNHSQIFDRIYSFLKSSFLNISVFCNLIVGWVAVFITEGTGIFHQNHILLDTGFITGASSWEE